MTPAPEPILPPEVDEAKPLEIRATPLAAFHGAHGGRLVAYAGHHLPVRFEAGVMEEHRACREACAMFDVSHMGQALLHGAGAAAALERLVPSAIESLGPGRQRYTMLLNEAGGVIDDLIVTRLDERTLHLVVNGARRAVDFAHLERGLPAAEARLEVWEERALVAVQGPLAASVIAGVLPGAEGLARMAAGRFAFEGGEALVARCGYTGEDGFEVSVPAGLGETLAERLFGAGAVPAGLGARDSLRLEAGLPLYGQDLDELTTPVEAGLAFVVAKARRESGGFVGDAVVLSQLRRGTTRRRVGIVPEGRAPARAGTVIATGSGGQAGSVTSGGFGPTVGGPISMGYVIAAQANPGTAVNLLIRGQTMPARVSALPFLPARTV